MSGERLATHVEANRLADLSSIEVNYHLVDEREGGRCPLAQLAERCTMVGNSLAQLLSFDPQLGGAPFCLGAHFAESRFDDAQEVVEADGPWVTIE